MHIIYVHVGLYGAILSRLLNFYEPRAACPAWVNDIEWLMACVQYRFRRTSLNMLNEELDYNLLLILQISSLIDNYCFLVFVYELRFLPTFLVITQMSGLFHQSSFFGTFSLSSSVTVHGSGVKAIFYFKVQPID